MAKKHECKCGIYVITNVLNGKRYVGQSIDIYNRWYRHQNPKTWAADKGKALYRAFIKYGVDNFTFEILEECPRNRLDAREKHWISFYNSYNNGYNMTKGGQGNQKRKSGFRRKNIAYRSLGEFVDYFDKEYPDIYSVFEEVRMQLCPDVYALEDIDDESIREEIDGYDTMLREWCDGYDSFEQWAECNLI